MLSFFEMKLNFSVKISSFVLMWVFEENTCWNLEWMRRHREIGFFFWWFLKGMFGEDEKRRNVWKERSDFKMRLRGLSWMERWSLFCGVVLKVFLESIVMYLSILEWNGDVFSLGLVRGGCFWKEMNWMLVDGMFELFFCGCLKKGVELMDESKRRRSCCVWGVMVWKCGYFEKEFE